MSPIEVTIQSLRINPIHNKWQLMFENQAGHYLPVFLEESQANLIRQEMIKPGSVELGDIEIPSIDFKANRLESVIINDLKGNILKTRLIIQHDNEYLQIDCPVEKAIVLALREGVPILMEDKNIKNKANWEY